MKKKLQVGAQSSLSPHQKTRGTFDRTWEKIACVLLLGGVVLERRETIGMELSMLVLLLVAAIFVLNALFDRGRQTGSMWK